MTKSDIQRIGEAANNYASECQEEKNMHNPEKGRLVSALEKITFKAGAQYEHPIAYNQAIEDVIALCKNNPGGATIEEIKKLIK